MTTRLTGGGRGTTITPGAGGSVFVNLELSSQLVTNALQSPWAAPNALAVPTADLLVKVHDAAGNEAIWTYRAAAAVAKGVQLT